MHPHDYPYVVFDLDDTLLAEQSCDLMPGVIEWFEEFSEGKRFAIATNQGGVGLRYWMEMFGYPGRYAGDHPDNYPTEDYFWSRIDFLKDTIPALEDARVFVAFSYQEPGPNGKWCPVPPRVSDRRAWRQHARKPNPGMLLDCINHFGGHLTRILYVGDRATDQAAARACNMTFEWSRYFFGE